MGRPSPWSRDVDVGDQISFHLVRLSRGRGCEVADGEHAEQDSMNDRAEKQRMSDGVHEERMIEFDAGDKPKRGNSAFSENSRRFDVPVPEFRTGALNGKTSVMRPRDA